MEWIEHPLLMLEVRGSNPGHSISKNTTSLPETKWLFGARCVASFPELGVTPGSDKKKNYNPKSVLRYYWQYFTSVPFSTILWDYSYLIGQNCPNSEVCSCNEANIKQILSYLINLAGLDQF